MKAICFGAAHHGIEGAINLMCQPIYDTPDEHGLLAIQLRLDAPLVGNQDEPISLIVERTDLVQDGRGPQLQITEIRGMPHSQS